MQSSKQKNNNPKFWHDVQIYDIEDVESIDQDHSPTINIKFINSKPKNHNNLAHPSKPKDIEDTQTATVSGTPLADSKLVNVRNRGLETNKISPKTLQSKKQNNFITPFYFQNIQNLCDKPAIKGGQDQYTFTLGRDKSGFQFFKPIYHLRFLRTKEYVVSAKMDSNLFGKTFLLAKSSKNFTENSKKYIGKIKINFLGNCTCIFGPGSNPTHANHKSIKLRRMLATIVYQNIKWTIKSCNFLIYLIKNGTDYYQLEGTQEFGPQIPLNKLYDIGNNKDMIHLIKNLNQDEDESKTETRYLKSSYEGKKNKGQKNRIIEYPNFILDEVSTDKYTMHLKETIPTVVGFGIGISLLSHSSICG